VAAFNFDPAMLVCCDRAHGIKLQTGWRAQRKGEWLMKIEPPIKGRDMHHFEYRGSELHAENVPISSIAEKVKTPFYLYSHATLKHHFEVFDGAFEDIPHITCFSVKANSNIAILRLFSSMGSGVDIVSGGELHRALAAGLPGEKIVYNHKNAYGYSP